MAVDNSFLGEIASASGIHVMFSSQRIITIKFMEIGWDSLKADAYTACDSNSVPTSKVSHIWYENVGI